MRGTHTQEPMRVPTNDIVVVKRCRENNCGATELHEDSGNDGLPWADRIASMQASVASTLSSALKAPLKHCPFHQASLC